MKNFMNVLVAIVVVISASSVAVAQEVANDVPSGVATVPENPAGRETISRLDDEPVPVIHPEIWMDYDWTPFTVPGSTARCVRLNTCPARFVGDAGKKA